jgi:molecular chaperone DnaK (HSP70)
MTLKFTEEDLDLSELILRTRLESLIQKELRTGGSSEILAYINLLRKRFGSARIKEINPFTTIVGGLALKGYERSQAS